MPVVNAYAGAANRALALSPGRSICNELMNGIGEQPARGTPFRRQIAHHAHELGVAPLIEPDNRLDWYAGKYTFDDHLIVHRLVEVIGRVWIVTRDRFERRLHRRADRSAGAREQPCRSGKHRKAL